MGTLYAVVVNLRRWCETLAGLKRTVESDPLHVVERDRWRVRGPVAKREVEVAVAEDPVLADQVAHAGATVRVRLETAQLQPLAGSLGHSFEDADLLAYLLHLLAVLV